MSSDTHNQNTQTNSGIYEPQVSIIHVLNQLDKRMEGIEDRMEKGFEGTKKEFDELRKDVKHVKETQDKMKGSVGAVKYIGGIAGAVIGSAFGAAVALFVSYKNNLNC